MYSREVSDLNYIKDLSHDYVKQNEDGLFYLVNVWDREEAKSYNVDYYITTSYFKSIINDLNKGK